VRADGPVHDIQVVHVLLDDVIAGKPREVEPVAELPLHVRPLISGGIHPQAAHVPVAAGGDGAAQLTAVDPLHHALVTRFVAALGAGHHTQALGIGRVGRGEDRAHAGRIHGHGLLHEDLLGGLDGGGEMRRPEVGGRGQDDHVNLAGHEPLVGVEADVAPLVGDRAALAGRAEAHAARLQPVREDVGQGHDAHLI